MRREERFEQYLDDVQPVIAYRLKKWKGLKTPREDLQQEAMLSLWLHMDKLEQCKEATERKKLYSRILELRLHEIHKHEHFQGLWVQEPAERIEEMLDRYSQAPVVFCDPWIEERRRKNREYASRPEVAERDKTRAKEYREAHREEWKAKRKAYYDAHAEELRLKRRLYYQEHKEEIREREREKERERRRKKAEAEGRTYRPYKKRNREENREKEKKMT